MWWKKFVCSWINNIFEVSYPKWNAIELNLLLSGCRSMFCARCTGLQARKEYSVVLWDMIDSESIPQCFAFAPLLFRIVSVIDWMRHLAVGQDRFVLSLEALTTRKRRQCPQWTAIYLWFSGIARLESLSWLRFSQECSSIILYWNYSSAVIIESEFETL